MKITEFTIRNFKSFSNHPNTPTDKVRALTAMNMLYGYNNSGKSNILKFLELIFRPKKKNERITVEGEGELVRSAASSFGDGIISDSAFIFHKNERKTPIEFQLVLEISHKELKGNLAYKFKELKSEYLSKTHDYATVVCTGKIISLDNFNTGEISLSEVKFNSWKIFELGANSNPLYFSTDESNKLKGDKKAYENLVALFTGMTILLDNNRDINSGVLKIPTQEQLSPSNFKKWFHELYLDPKTYSTFEKLIAFIRSNKVTLDNNDNQLFKDVERHSPLGNFVPEFSKIQDGEIELMLKIGKDRLPISSFGTGIQQIMYILTSIFITKARVILIEELEMNLSPKYQKKLLGILRELINSKEIDQVFFTTHSKYLTYRNDFSIYEVQMTDRKSTIRKVTAQNHLNRFFDIS